VEARRQKAGVSINPVIPIFHYSNCDDLVKSRLTGPAAGTIVQCFISVWDYWIPAFAGMTVIRIFRFFTRPSMVTLFFLSTLPAPSQE